MKIRIYFTGMCLNAFHGDPKSPSKVDVIMLKGFTSDGVGYRHRPVLTLATSVVAAGGTVDRAIIARTPSLESSLYLGTVDLEGYDYRLELDGVPMTGLMVNTEKIPDDGRPVGDNWNSIEWVSDPARAAGDPTMRVNRKALPDEKTARHGAVAATFRLPPGQLHAVKPPDLQSQVLFEFHPGKPQAFTDTTVLEYEGDPKKVILIGDGFGDHQGLSRRIELETGKDIDLYVSNLPGLVIKQFDHQDFSPFFDVLTPVLAPNARPKHWAPSVGEFVFCMLARARV